MMSCSICERFDFKDKRCLAFDIKIKGKEHKKADKCECFKIHQKEAIKRGNYAKIQAKIHKQ